VDAATPSCHRRAVPRFEPFPALRYDTARVDLDAVVAPPYDVLSDEDRARFADRDEHNIVHVDLPRSVDGGDPYDAAAAMLERWRADGTLTLDPAPSFTMYRMRFTDHTGRDRQTVGVLGALEVVDVGAGGVLPHERTTPKAATDRLELTPRGARKMGERALTRVFERLTRDREGTHEARDPGGLAEPTGQTRPWRFGDHGQIDVQRTVFNAVTRGAASEGVVRLHPDDFELVEAEERTETATALLLDLSFSMPLRGHLVHAKKMALALHALIEGRYPHDTLYLIGFSDFARRLQPEELATPGFERTYGTNMQHAFLMAGRLLAQHPRAARQVIMVTDGEPTAHLEGEQAFFAWPPEPETIRLTLAEAVRLSRSGVTLNIFMLEDSDGLARFMERLAERTGGRVFLMDDHNVGEFVLRDYVRHRSR